MPQAINLWPLLGVCEYDAVVNVHSKCGVACLRHQFEEGRGVEGGEDRGHRRPLGGADRLVAFISEGVVEGEGDSAVSQERINPCRDRLGETEDAQGMGHSSPVDVVEEAFDVEKQGCASITSFHVGLDIMEEVSPASTVHEKALVPNWVVGRRECLSASKRRRLATTFSNSLLRHSIKEMGRYDLAWR